MHQLLQCSMQTGFCMPCLPHMRLVRMTKTPPTLSGRTSSLTGALKPRSSEGTGCSGTSVNTKSCLAPSSSSTCVVAAAPFSCP